MVQKAFYYIKQQKKRYKIKQEKMLDQNLFICYILPTLFRLKFLAIYYCIAQSNVKLLMFELKQKEVSFNSISKNGALINF